jgi:hypothetical protein
MARRPRALARTSRSVSTRTSSSKTTIDWRRNAGHEVTGRAAQKHRRAGLLTKLLGSRSEPITVSHGTPSAAAAAWIRDDLPLPGSPHKHTATPARPAARRTVTSAVLVTNELPRLAGDCGDCRIGEVERGTVVNGVAVLSSRVYLINRAVGWRSPLRGLHSLMCCRRLCGVVST